jgi:hypothetical protein
MENTVGFCPNYDGCQFVKNDKHEMNECQKANYLKSFCESDENLWENCKRYITKKTLNLCPDFVLPDSAFTIDEIIDILENN